MPEGFDVWDFLKNIATNVGSITAISAFLFAIVKPLRKWIISKIKKLAGHDENVLRDNGLEAMFQELTMEFRNTAKEQCEKIDQIQEQQNVMLEKQECLIQCNVDLLRSDINKLYFKYLPAMKLPIFEKENLIKMYTSYKKFGGNTYVDAIYKDMLHWEPFQKEIKIEPSYHADVDEGEGKGKGANG
jgi:hypothetical protein